MGWKPSLNLTANARLFTAVYIGALVMGPPFGSWTILAWMRTYWGLALLLYFAAVPLGGFAAGMIGGRDHGLRAALIALFLSKSATAAGLLFEGAARDELAGAIGSLLVATLLVGLLIGWVAVGGEVVSERYGLAGRLENWRHWRKVGLLLLLLFTYSLTLGRYVAVRTVGYSHLKAYPVGVYIAVAREPFPGLANNPTSYLDPTGLLVIGEYCLRTKAGWRGENKAEAPSDSASALHKEDI